MPRGRPRTRPVRTTPKRKYSRSYRYTKEAKAQRKAEAAFRRQHRGHAATNPKSSFGMPTDRRRGYKNLDGNFQPEFGAMSAMPTIKRSGRKAKIANIVPSF